MLASTLAWCPRTCYLRDSLCVPQVMQKKAMARRGQLYACDKRPKQCVILKGTCITMSSPEQCPGLRPNFKPGHVGLASCGGGGVAATLRVQAFANSLSVQRPRLTPALLQRKEFSMRDSASHTHNYNQIAGSGASSAYKMNMVNLIAVESEITYKCGLKC